ncbi:MAG: tRNA (adenosine(37)-N6)-threonylcarbamoyltransferase complex dimerization subunit type 1 TsaB [Akkermansia sp.]|nr:tRNA (adenosine(37)-N6)-threonylcarbamoyltransferase complex dimerization subunit type 1 TsaB [Akkermansia sp.]
MNILAIETSVPQASLCLYAKGCIKFSTSWHAERNHDAHLFPALQQALDCLTDADNIDYILVGAGPGSYGGVRVALAAGVGISTVTNAHLVAVESWAQLATQDTCVVADARRGGWTVRYPDGHIDVLSTEQLQQLPQPLYSVEPAGVLEAKGMTNVQKEGLIPTAEGLVDTWLEMTEAEREILAGKPAEPIYVRPPHITAAAKKPWEI